MRAVSRRAQVRALAKINLSLEVLHKRPDGYHDIRTVFQTVSLSDTLDFEFVPGRRRRVLVDCDVEIPNNIVVRAAEAVEIRGWDLDQREVSVHGRGYLARAFQHEMDHLDGILLWDRMSKIQREVLKNEWKRSQRDTVRG